MIGDSLTAGATGTNNAWGRKADTDNLTRVEKFAIVNAGTGGERTYDMRARFDADVLALAPDVIHVLGGINDIGTDDRDSALIIADLDAMVTDGLTSGAEVILGTVTPSDYMDTPGKLATLDAVNAWVRAQSGRCSIAEYATPLSVGGLGHELDDAYHTDGVHWSADAEGIQVAANVLAPILTALA